MSDDMNFVPPGYDDDEHKHRLGFRDDRCVECGFVFETPKEIIEALRAKLAEIAQLFPLIIRDNNTLAAEVETSKAITRCREILESFETERLKERRS